MADGSDNGSSPNLGVIAGALLLGGVLLLVFGGFPSSDGGEGPDIRARNHLVADATN